MFVTDIYDKNYTADYKRSNMKKLSEQKST